MISMNSAEVLPTALTDRFFSRATAAGAVAAAIASCSRRATICSCPSRRPAGHRSASAEVFPSLLQSLLLIIGQIRGFGLAQRPPQLSMQNSREGIEAIRP